MTMRDKRGRYIKRQPAPMRTHWSDNLAAKIRATPPWVLFLWLAVTAVAYAYVGKLVVIAFLVWLAIKGVDLVLRQIPAHGPVRFRVPAGPPRGPPPPLVAPRARLPPADPAEVPRPDERRPVPSPGATAAGRSKSSQTSANP